MSERVRRMRRGLERGEKEHVALLIDCFKKRTDRRTLTPYALLLPQELSVHHGAIVEDSENLGKAG